MQISTLAVIALAASAQAGFIRKIFGRDELEQVVLQARAATLAQWFGKIENWQKPEPVGMSDTVKKILITNGCKPPTGAKAKRSLDAEVSDTHMLLVRASPPIAKADAWDAAKSPATLPQPIKQAFQKAGWSGTCVGNGAVKARGLENEFDEFDLYAREFDEESFYEY